MTDTLFFYVSKVVWLASNPGTLLLVCLILGVLLLWTRWWRRGRGLLLLLAMVSIIITTIPLGAMVLIPLEERFSKPETLPERVDGIIILGGLANPLISQIRGRPELGEAIDRLTEGAWLSRRYPDAKVVFTGGTGSLLNQNIKESDVLGPTFRLLGLGERGRFILENQSRNTVENALNTRALVNPKPGETWVLITSAFHMPRAVGVFRRAGWSIIPYPVDYRYAGFEASRPQFSLIKGLGALNNGLHEWLGLIAYRATGKTDALFPSP